MRNTFSWSCSSCGEYNVVDLTGKPGPRIRCDFCFQPVEAAPGLAEEPPAAPSQSPSDDWIGGAAVPPFFSAGSPSRARSAARDSGKADIPPRPPHSK
jgi:hypothetical protein